MSDETTTAVKYHKVKFYAAWAKWVVELVGAVIEFASSNPAPKKADYVAD
jgi:hypothetical protein